MCSCEKRFLCYGKSFTLQVLACGFVKQVNDSPPPALPPSCRILFSEDFTRSSDLKVLGWSSSRGSTGNTCEILSPKVWEPAYRDARKIIHHKLPCVFCSTPFKGSCADNFTSSAGILTLSSPRIQLKPGVDINNLQFWFDHYFSMEEFWDGGNLQVQINQQPFVFVQNRSFLSNGYPSYLKISDDEDGETYLSTNPSRGQMAFTGGSAATTARGAWVRSGFNLTHFHPKVNDSVVVIWQVSTDACTGWDGWYIDNVALASCPRVPNRPEIRFRR